MPNNNFKNLVLFSNNQRKALKTTSVDTFKTLLPELSTNTLIKIFTKNLDNPELLKSFTSYYPVDALREAIFDNLSYLDMRAYEFIPNKADFFNYKDKFGQTHLHTLIDMCEEAFSDELLQKVHDDAVDIEFTHNDQNENVLHIAARRNLEKIQLFYDKIPKEFFNSTTKKINSSVQHFAHNMSASFFKQTITRIENLNALNIKRNDLLYNLAKHERLDLIKILYEVCLDYENLSKVPALYAAILNKNTEIFDYLLPKNTNLNYKTSTGADALWLACRYFEPHIFETVLNAVNIEPENYNVSRYVGTNGYARTFTEEIFQAQTEYKNIRHYEHLLLQYGSVESLKMLQERGLLTNNAHYAFSSALKAPDAPEKVAFLLEHQGPLYASLEELYIPNQWSSTAYVNKFFLLNIIHNSRDIVPDVEYYTNTHHLEFNELDWAMATVWAIKNSNQEVFDFCRKPDILDVLKLVESDAHNKSQPSILMNIKELDAEFLKTNREFLKTLVRENFSLSGEFLFGFANVDLINDYFEASPHNLYSMLGHMSYESIKKNLPLMDSLDVKLKEVLQQQTNILKADLSNTSLNIHERTILNAKGFYTKIFDATKELSVEEYDNLDKNILNYVENHPIVDIGDYLMSELPFADIAVEKFVKNTNANNNFRSAVSNNRKELSYDKIRLIKTVYDKMELNPDIDLITNIQSTLCRNTTLRTKEVIITKLLPLITDKYTAESTIATYLHPAFNLEKKEFLNAAYSSIDDHVFKQQSFADIRSYFELRGYTAQETDEFLISSAANITYWTDGEIVKCLNTDNFLSDKILVDPNIMSKFISVCYNFKHYLNTPASDEPMHQAIQRSLYHFRDASYISALDISHDNKIVVEENFLRQSVNSASSRKIIKL